MTELDINSLTETQKDELKMTGRVLINGELYKLKPVLDVKVLRTDGTVEQY